ncbi:hypothetical protein [Stutzerimonas stutzeri]|uniref:hypothetical protein n=1 Tax=Stutzerimonas stutzeri TaxID=316 RepID=UPI00210B274C|nr:hypothetical protein [Stutzerimonas stutzeri]MCQ4243166.1 hypothetical protein [Stutzerimonas stutzeri]
MARLNALVVIVPMAAPMTIGVRCGVMIDAGPGKLVACHLSVAKRTSQPGDENTEVKTPSNQRTLMAGRFHEAQLG